MPTILKSETFTVRNYSGTGHYNYKIEIILNSQDSANNKSNITIKTYQNRGSAGYSGNGYIKFSLWGHTSQNTTDTQWVAPVKVTENNTVSSGSWWLLDDLTYTADFAHKTDKSLAIRAIVKLDNTGSYHAQAPVDANMECVTNVPPFSAEWTELDTPQDWLLSSIGSDVNGTPMSFTFTPKSGVAYHKLYVNTSGTAVVDENNVPDRDTKRYNSGDVVNVSNTRLLWLLDEMRTADATELEATATLESFNSSGTSIGSNAKSFKIIGSGMGVKAGGVWKDGIAWVKVGNDWEPGIVWAKDGDTWKKGIGLTDE